MNTNDIETTESQQTLVNAYESDKQFFKKTAMKYNSAIIELLMNYFTILKTSNEDIPTATFAASDVIAEEFFSGYNHEGKETYASVFTNMIDAVSLSSLKSYLGVQKTCIKSLCDVKLLINDNDSEKAAAEKEKMLNFLKSTAVSARNDFKQKFGMLPCERVDSNDINDEQYLHSLLSDNTAVKNKIQKFESKKHVTSEDIESVSKNLPFDNPAWQMRNLGHLISPSEAEEMEKDYICNNLNNNKNNKGDSQNDGLLPR